MVLPHPLTPTGQTVFPAGTSGRCLGTSSLPGGGSDVLEPCPSTSSMLVSPSTTPDSCRGSSTLVVDAEPSGRVEGLTQPGERPQPLGMNRLLVLAEAVCPRGRTLAQQGGCGRE